MSKPTEINVNGVEGQEPEPGRFLKNLTLIYWRYTEAIRIEWSNSATWAKVHRNNMYDVNEDLREACSYVPRFTFAQLARCAAESSFSPPRSWCASSLT